MDTDTKSTSSILELVGTVVVNATTSEFIARKKFVRNTVPIDPKTKVRISYIGYNFFLWFLMSKGKIEGPNSKQTLCYYNLQQAAVNKSIIAELDGEDKALTTLSEMFFLMKKQGKGEDGVLLNNGYSNIFYINDTDGILREVHICYSVGWDVFARLIGSQSWNAGRRVFSRDLKS